MKRKLPIIFLIIGILLILLGLSWIVYVKMVNEEKLQREIENIITDDYEVFKSRVEDFNLKRAAYYTDIVDNLYVDAVKDEYDNWTTYLDGYTTSVDGVEDSSENLKAYCVDGTYSNKDISNKCEAFKIAYETVINYYTKDIMTFNEVVSEYRNDNKVTEEEFSDYTLKYNYTDIDDDGKYIGKD